MCKLNESEWPVLDLLWEKGPLSAKEIIAVLGPGQDWHPSTVKTLLGRLVAKGAISQEQGNKVYVYQAKISREDCIEVESKSLVDRLFKGSASSMVSALIQNQDLNKHDLEELRSLIDRLAKEGGRE